MKSILSNLTPEHIYSDPFPHIVIEDPLPADLAFALAKEFPPLSVVTQGEELGSNKRFSLSAPLVKKSPLVSPLWKEFIALHSSPAFFHEWAALFGNEIERVFPDFKSRFGSLSDMRPGIRNQDTFDSADILMDAQICINSPIKSDPSAVKVAHIDAVNKLFAGLWYLRLPEDDSAGGDLELFRAKSRYRLHGPRLIDKKYVECVKTIPYKRNTLVLFLNTPDSIHGVSIRGATQYPRLFVNFLGEVKEPLFDLSSLYEGFFSRQMRKIGISR